MISMSFQHCYQGIGNSGMTPVAIGMIVMEVGLTINTNTNSLLSSTITTMISSIQAVKRLIILYKKI